MTDRSTASSSLPCDATRRVLTSRDLLRHITTFKRGWPQVLVDFWDAHHAFDGRTERCRREDKPGRLLDLLMRFGNPHLAELALGIQFRDSCGWWRSLREKAGSGYDAAIQHGRVDMLEWALSHNQHFASALGMWQYAFQYPAEDPAMFDLIFARFPDESREQIRERVEAPHVYVKHPNAVVLLKWITEAFPDIKLSSEVADDAAAAGNLALVRYLHEHRAAEEGCTRRGFVETIYQSRFDVFEYLLRIRPELFDPAPIEHSIGWGDMHVLVGIKDIGFPELLRGHEAKVLETVWHTSSTYMLDWFMDNNIFAPASVSIDELACWDIPGLLDSVRRLHESGVACATTQAVDFACELGNWDIVRFLLAHRTEGFTQCALDEAEAAGAADIVQLLHDHEHLKAAPREVCDNGNHGEAIKHTQVDQTAVE